MTAEPHADRSSRLAVQGGSPVRSRPFPPRATTTERDREAALRVLDRALADDGTVGYAGPEEDAYCEEFARLLGGGLADAVTSGSAAVFVALRSLDLPAGSEVVVPAFNDAGSTMAVGMAGCTPVICDTAPDSYNAGPDEVAARITDRTGAILFPYIGGEVVDPEALLTLAQQHGLPLVEDCAQAHLATWGDRALGTFGAVAAFSTMHLKHHNTGGQGGVVFTRDPEVHQRGRWHADRGKPFGLPAGSTNVVAALNLNSDELHAAIGRSQLAELPARLAARRRAADGVLDGVAEATDGIVTAPDCPDGCVPSYWFLRLRLDADRLRSTDKAGFVEALKAEGIPLLGDPMMPHEGEWFARATSAPPPETPAARAALEGNVSVGVNDGWTDAEVADTLEAMAKVCEGLR